ncbi:MAG TPA: hypothetical protein VKN63_06360 [Afifellaceae bacterium]|nr:hypothetical protein [Afifellaceae bacterium]
MRFNNDVLPLGVGLACFAGLVGIALPLLSSPVVAADEEKPAEIIAAQIRRQGLSCENPQDAQRDAEASKPDEAVWVLHCDNASYRVRLIPDMAAHVERIE